MSEDKQKKQMALSHTSITKIRKSDDFNDLMNAVSQLVKENPHLSIDQSRAVLMEQFGAVILRKGKPCPFPSRSAIQRYISKFKSTQIQQDGALDLQTRAVFLMTELTSLLKKLEREI